MTSTSDLTIDELHDEIARLQAWVADLQSGMYVNCVYCGHRYGPGETTPVSMADALKAHVAQCPEHPMAACVAALRTANEQLSLAAGYVVANVNHHPSMAAGIELARREVTDAIAKATGAPP